jgi:predicted acylesterase/phospholipase RssA
LIDRIGQQHARGRRLFVGTANLDAQRMVIWNMGVIAASKAPGRYALFRQVMLASSSIPAVFPPVMIQADAGSRTISEMHVDGGTTAQILTLPDDALQRGRGIST